MFMPESPYYLLSKGMKDEATDALAKLRGKTTSGVQKELDEMQVNFRLLICLYHKGPVG